jgi:acyl-CoA synthetase (AMP-forming)/AMP-acid ligase II
MDRSKVLIFDNAGQAIPDGFKSWRSLLEHGDRDWDHFDGEKVSQSTTAARLFSSGTIVLPKVAAISHKKLAQHTLVYEASPIPYEVRMLCTCEHYT